jgi:hypothetical protein
LRHINELSEERAMLEGMNYPCASCRHLCGAQDLSKPESDFKAASVECTPYRSKGAILGPHGPCEKYKAIKAALVH